jgi:hypothetical protein
LVEKKKPARRCIACNEQKEKQELLRIVRTPEKNIEIDLTGKKNGRGAYICKKEECLNKIIKSKRLERTFEMPISQDFYDEVRGIIIGK